MNTPKPPIIIAIDGYSSCGKSTLAKDLAQALQYIYIDSGAMYRATTLYFLQNNIAIENNDNLLQILNNNIHITFKINPNNPNAAAETYLNQKNVALEIRSKEINENVSKVSTLKLVRHFLVKQQQAMGLHKGIVMDGRDIGTAVFPNAELKLFMTADIKKRTERRYAELQSKNIPMTFEEIQKNLLERDYIDTTRTETPLVQAPDAIVIDNTNLTLAQQLEIALKLANEKISSLTF